MSEKLLYYNGNVEIDEPPSMYQIPPSTRKVDPNTAYEPEVVSIGPYHRQNPKPHAMEDHKWRYMHNLLRRRSGTDQSDSADEVLKRFIGKVSLSVARARRCYEVPDFYRSKKKKKVPNFSSISNYDFVKLLVLDGCFILELFLKLSLGEPAARDDLIYRIPWMFPAIWRDLLKLENQIPFFILQDLFTASGIETTEPSISWSLEKLAFKYLEHGPLALGALQDQGGNKIYHLLHFYHMLLQPSCCKAAGTSDNYIILPRSLLLEKVKNVLTIPCVVELQRAGIEFRRKQDAKAVLDVAFKDGVLHVPRLFVDDDTNTVFRNLLALEQFCPGNSLHVTIYTTFLDCIVNSAQDVLILEQRDILSYLLGSEGEVARLINRLGNGVTFSVESHYLSGVFREVNEYCDSKWHKHRASCMRDYFGSPWSTISLLAAVALLLMTLIQVIFAILSNRKQ